MAIKLKGNRVAIEKLKKKDKGVAGSLIMPENEEYLGIIRYTGSSANSEFQVGQKVYFSTNYQQSRMGGVDLCVMEDKEIFAVVEE